MPIFKGEIGTEAVYRGNIEIAKVYKGSALVYENFKVKETQGIPPIYLSNCKNTNMLGYKIYGQSLQGGLPNGYTQVEYIETTGSSMGTQYIDTEYVPSKDGYTVEVVFNQSSTNRNAGCFVYGSYDSNGGGYKPSLYIYASTYKMGVYYNASSSKNTSITCEADTDYKVTIATVGKNISYDINGSTGSITNSYNQLDNNTPIYIFTTYVGNTYILKTRIKSFKIYDENGVLVRNLIPCVRNSDSVRGMYDLATLQFFTRKGTGTLDIGGTIGVPNQYKQLDYIENTDSTYINTGLVGKSGYTLETDLSFSQLSTGNYQYFAGYSYTGSSDRIYFIRAANSTNALGYTYGPDNTGTSSLGTLSTNTWYTFKSVMKAGLQELYWDGTKVGTTSFADLPIDPDNPVYIYMFISQYVSTVNGPTKCKCRYAKWYDENNQLIRHFVPCERMSDNTVGMYDLVEGKFYEPQGTGTFTKGDYSLSNLSSEVPVESCGDKTKNMVDRPSSITFTGYTNILPYCDTLELNVPYKFVWSKAIKGGTNEIGVNVRGDVAWLPDLLNPNGGSQTFTYTTTLPDAIYIYANGKNAQASVGVTSTIEGLMIVKADQTNDYEPYGYDIPVQVNDDVTHIYLSEPLRKIGNAADYIDLETQKVVRNISVYKGNSSYPVSTFYRNDDPNMLMFYSTNLLTGGKYGITNKICNVLPVVSAGYTVEHIQGATIAATATWLQLYLLKTSLPGYSDSMTDSQLLTLLRQWIVANNFTVYYERASATESSVTLPNILLDRGANTISVLTDVGPSNMYIKYKGK